MGGSRWTVALCAACAVAASAPAARGQHQQQSTPDESSPSSWYGWQILFIDGAAAALVGVGAVSDSSSNATAIDLAIASSVAYLGGGPLVHGLHGHGVAAGESFLLRLGLPFAMGLLGAAGAWAFSGGCPANGCAVNPGEVAIGGALFGVVSASILDVAMLAHETRARDSSAGLPVRLEPTPLLLREAGRRDVPGFGLTAFF